MDAPQRRRGRRPVSSRATLVDAAEELFLENGYDSTTIEQVTRRAGVSRNTFFNYFMAKSDLLFAGIDDTVNGLIERLETVRGDDPLTGLRDAILRAAAEVTALEVPLAATQWDAMGAAAVVRSSGVIRFSRLAEALRRFLDARFGEEGGGGRVDGVPSPCRAAAYALAGALVAAGMDWLGDGVGRGPLPRYVAAAVDPVCDGFRHRLDAGAGKAAGSMGSQAMIRPSPGSRRKSGRKAG